MSDRSEYKKNYYLKNRESILKKQKIYDQNKKERITNYQKEYHKEYNKIYYANNKERCHQTHNRYDMRRRARDPAYKLRKNCSTMIWQALKDQKNNLSILPFLPYTMEELKLHLELQFNEHMSWENYGTYWHIDHIIPQSLLIYNSMEDENFKKCWALENLQPLEAIANIKKSNKLR